nr:LamG-like jellyroll fold domain-containing protein [Lewinella sp. W8]
MTSYVGEGNQYWRSQDGGVSWEALHDFGAEVFHFDISRANPNYVYLIANNGIYRSTDRGASFNSISLPPGLTASNARRGRINVSGTDPDEIWFLDWNAGANSNRDRVWYSSNGGTSWSSWHTPALAGRKWTAMAHQVGSNGGVYIASERGSTGTLPAKVFYRDRGMSQWVDYSAGLPASANPTKILPYYRGNALRWAGNRGVWQIPLYQENWAPVAQPFVDGTERFCQRDAVHFDSYSVAKGNATYQWSIPEATTTTALNQREVTAEFPGPGTYTATLTVSQPGGSSTESVSVTISPECDPEPRPGNSAYFNGSGAATSSEPLNLTTNEMTFSAWIKRDGNQPDNAGIIFMRGGTAVGLNFGNDNELRFHWNNAQWWWDSGLVVNDQEWAHVAMVVTPTGVTLYLNGHPANRSFSAPAVTFDSPLFFGRDPNHSSRYFRGEMDEVCIYNRSLSQAEIRESMHLTRTDGGEVGLLAYYQFNRDEGQVTDRFGTNHLNLGGGAFRGQSTAPVGPGSSARKTITAPGSYGFGDTGLTLNFDTGVTPDGELCVTRLKIQPDRLPAAEVSSSYWVVHNFGVNESFSPLQSLMFAEVNGINAGIVAAPSQLKLYKRKSVGEGDTWGDFVAEATAAATSNGGEVTFGVGNNQTSFSQFIISFETPALGAELLNFTARIQNQKSVDVSWVSSGEENLDRYEVLRSRDGQNFTLLTTVSAAGNSEEELSYGFLDVSPHRGRSFYRLRMVDFDGTVTFSEVRSVVVGALSEPVMLYPNPVARGEQLTVVTDLAGVLSLSLYSVTGQEVGRFVFQGDANLHLGQLPAGVYLYQIRGEAYRKGGRLIITE